MSFLSQGYLYICTLGLQCRLYVAIKKYIVFLWGIEAIHTYAESTKRGLPIFNIGLGWMWGWLLRGNLSYAALIESAYNGYVVSNKANGYDINSNLDGSKLAPDGTVGKMVWILLVSSTCLSAIIIRQEQPSRTLALSACANHPCCSCENW